MTDIGLPVWSERVKRPYHIIPNRLKEDNEVLFMDINVVCDTRYHNSFSSPPHWKRNTPCQVAKSKCSFHCSLADVSEMYLFYRGKKSSKLNEA